MKVKNACAASVAVCLCLSFYSERGDAAGVTNLLTVCTSAATTTQASKCTAWQYNVYSPAAYIESYPQVSPGPAAWTDPAYEYLLGSTITPTMGVKVCPTALTPGASFKSASADPCPNNKLVAASTVIPTSSFAIATTADGIVVYQISADGVNEVPGGPFVPSSVPQGAPVETTPSLTAVDPTGHYLYAFYNTPQTGFDDAPLYSYELVNGVPHQVSIGPNLGGISIDPASTTLIAAAHHVYIDSVTFHHVNPYIEVLTTSAGVMTSAFEVSSAPLVDASGGGSVYGSPIGFDVDAGEKFLYWYWSNTGNGVANNVAIFSLDFSSSSATLISVVPTQGRLTLVK